MPSPPILARVESARGACKSNEVGSKQLTDGRLLARVPISNPVSMHSFFCNYEVVGSRTMFAVSAQSGAKSAGPTRKIGPIDLALLAEKQLHNNQYHLKNVHCAVEGGTLVLRGTLPSFYLKQVAQETVVTLPGITEIVNLIE